MGIQWKIHNLPNCRSLDLHASHNNALKIPWTRLSICLRNALNGFVFSKFGFLLAWNSGLKQVFSLFFCARFLHAFSELLKFAWFSVVCYSLSFWIWFGKTRCEVNCLSFWFFTLGSLSRNPSTLPLGWHAIETVAEAIYKKKTNPK